MRIGDSVVMMLDARDGWPETPAFLRLYVADADATHRRAVAAGATSVTEVTGLLFDDRVGRVRDPLGNIWWIQAHVEDVDPAEMACRPREPGAMEALGYVETSLDAAMREAGPRGWDDRRGRRRRDARAQWPEPEVRHRPG